MSQLPIVHMTLYKHGVGFFQRRGPVEGEELTLTFLRDQMDDLLKSLTVIDHAGGQVRGVDYDTPQSKAQRLEGCSVTLADSRSLRDLIVALRGRDVRLKIHDGSNIQGTLLGIDESEDKPMKRMLVSILDKKSALTSLIGMENLEAVEIIDSTAEADLRFFLKTATGRETHRSITIRLNPGSHDLSVSYIAPAPGWRVSYRVVLDEDKSGKVNALLQGWGIFDNRLEEDLTAISLSLTAGMPISFIYDLYTPHTPERPRVKDESRTIAAPVMFAPAEAEAMPEELASMAAPAAGGRMHTVGRHRAMATHSRDMEEVSLDSLEDSTPVSAEGKAMGELFQYNVNVPVTVGRGQSAMVPIVGCRMDMEKALIYNGAKMATHPVASLRFKNSSGLTLERGPVTVMENGEYVGEAVLPFTTNKNEAVMAYAIELGVHVNEEHSSERQMHSISIKNDLLVQQSYDIRQTCYRMDNRTAQEKIILIERKTMKPFAPFDTPEPEEKTLETYRYKVTAPAGQITSFTVKERSMRAVHQRLRDLNLQTLKNYFENKFLDKKLYDDLQDLLQILAEVSRLEQVIKEEENNCKAIYNSQDQIQKKMAVLAKDGEEGKLRGRYVKQLTEKEEKLAASEKKTAETNTQIQEANTRFRHMLAQLKD